MTRKTMFAVFAALALGGSAAEAQEGPPRPPVGPPTIRVSATGEARAVPDLAWVDLGVETAGPTAQAAAQQNAAAMERVIAALVRAGVPRANIETRDYNVFPEYDPQPRPEGGEPRIRGYRVANTVSARTEDVARVGGLIDAGLGAGANRVNGVRFGVRDPARARAEALRNALRQARAEADVIAAGLGLSVEQVLDASTVSEPPRFFPAADAMMSERAASVATPIQPREQTVTATVVVIFRAANTGS